jgi:hypothetical protein
MNKLQSLGLAAVMAGALSSAFAADTSATINVRKAITPVGARPVVSVLRATATATGSFTVDLPAPRGRSNITGWDCMPRSAIGDVKNLRVSETTTGTLTVSNSTSNSLAVGDNIRCTVVSQ